MPCPGPGDSYDGRIRSILVSERDAAMRAACSAGKFIARLPQIPLDLKDDPDLLAFMRWYKKHRKRDKSMAISSQAAKVEELIINIAKIEELGGEPKPELFTKLRLAQRKLSKLRRTNPTKTKSY